MTEAMIPRERLIHARAIFKSNLWNCTFEEFVDAIREFKRELGYFDPDLFLKVNSHLTRFEHIRQKGGGI